MTLSLNNEAIEAAEAIYRGSTSYSLRDKLSDAIEAYLAKRQEQGFAEMPTTAGDATDYAQLVDRLNTRALDIQLAREPQEFMPNSMLLQQAAAAIEALQTQPKAGKG